MRKLIFILICLLGSSADAKYGGGTGGPNNPYLIADANHMQAIGADSNDWDKHFLLVNDIDLSAYTGDSFNIIGNRGNPFTGVFDGNGHTISNFTYECNDIDRVGLFGGVKDPNAVIKDLGLINPNVHGSNNGSNISTGSLVGELWEGTVTGCYAVGGNISAISTSHTFQQNCGGLIGLNYGTIANCYTTGSATNSLSDSYGLVSFLGGLVGENYGTIVDCYAIGNVWTESIPPVLFYWFFRHSIPIAIDICPF